MRKGFWILLLCIFINNWSAQAQQDMTADYIKSASFFESGMSVVPFFELGAGFTFNFDDLYGNESNYYYRVKAYNYDWTPSELKQIDFIKGLDNQMIKNYANSINTLQSYTHYSLSIPNNTYRITKSGNYVLEIFDSNENVVARRKFVLYENIVTVGLAVKRARNLDVIDTKQNLELKINLGEGHYINPIQNVKIALFQNGRWDSFITNVKPQYTIGTELLYKYDGETQFWAGNQFLNFDNSDIRLVNNSIFSTSSASGMYSTVLYPNLSRAKSGYTYFPDVNGAYKPRIVNEGRNPDSEGEYSWVYFSYKPINETPADITYYITGMFNNAELDEEAKLVWNENSGHFEKAMLIKQGFTNYSITPVLKGKVAFDQNPDGNFAQTTNAYSVLVYYRAPNDLYDRVIGLGKASAADITY